MKVSNGWLGCFLKRHKWTLRRRTTTAQKPPEGFTEVVCKFIVHVEKRRADVKFSAIFAMDQTPVWLNCPSSSTIEKKGAKDVSIVF